MVLHPKKNMSTLFLGLLLVSCASFRSSIYGIVDYSKATDEQKAYLEKVKNQPLVFNISLNDEEEAWDRAQDVVSNYSSMKIQVVTESVIQTYNPVNIGKYDVQCKWGYDLNKIKSSKRLTIKVSSSTQCVGLKSAKEAAIINAHIFSYYIKTGELPYPELISR